MASILSQLGSFAAQIIIAWLIWRFYRGRQFPIDQKYRTFGPRFWAPFVDTCVLWPVVFLIDLPLLYGKPSSLLTAGTVICQNVLWMTYTIWMHAQRGQTVGKVVCYVKVVDNATEGPITVWQAILRESVPLAASLGVIVYQIYLISAGYLSLNDPQLPKGEQLKTLMLVNSFPFCWFVAEVLTMFSNEKRRALHDFLAGTAVIRTNMNFRE